ncbi:hypothetical protein DRO19_00340 [Candidatus Bathyarchaeota archaeon]|nr:MAG: hypothetical protein DRO19_00340 [Candidatus Bathyarchaeota archaeon]
MHIYAMTKSVKSRIEKRIGQALKCPVCGRPIEVGQQVVTFTKRNVRIKVYHKKCYEKLLLEI